MLRVPYFAAGMTSYGLQASVQFGYLYRSGLLMEPVDILRDDPDDLAFGLPLGNVSVAFVGLNAFGYIKPCHVKFPE